MPGIAALVVAIVVGVIASTWKGRSAAGWGITAFIFVIAVWWFLDQLVGVAEPQLRHMSSGRAAIVIMAIIVGTLPVLLGLAVTPRLRTALSDARPRVPCPVCRELILVDAMKCRFCGAELMPPAAGSNAVKRPVDGA